jgi:uncharacterized membrane protein (UPF0182 family)
VSRPFRPFDPFESSAEIRIPRPPRRFWIGLGFFGVAILIFFIAGPVVTFLTDLQWYQALGLDEVYLTRVKLQLLLFFGSFAVALLFAALNVLLALRVRAGPSLLAVGIRRASVRSVAGVAGMLGAVFIAIVLSAGAGSRWQDLALFTNYVATGTTEPVFGLDVSFYLLQLPFWHDVVNWALGLGFLTLLMAGLLYTWRGDGFDFRITPLGIGHLSALLGFVAVVLAANAWLGRYDLLYSHNGFVWGAGYTDVNARVGLAAITTFVGIALAVVLAANLRIRRRAVPVYAIGIWVLMLLVSGIYPSLVQRLTVTPSEQQQERPYIQREIQGTRQAFGLDNVTTRNFNGNAPLTKKDIDDDRVTIDNLRLWDYRPLQDTYTQLQTIRTYYSFQDIDLDRYVVNGKYQQLEISAREFVPDKLPPQSQTWVNQRLTYTHGYGVAASPVNAVVGEGLPDYIVKDIPPVGSIPVDRPAIYFGEATNNYVLAPSAQPEIDYSKGSGEVTTSYTGTHGVRMEGSNRTLWALRTGDFNLLISNQIQDRTEILYQRNIVNRVQAIAPFLTLDRDPYIVISEGRLFWILDAYTSASTYPYSQVETNGLGGNDVNYVRNSVKVVVDAYEGTPDFYINDPKDPLIRAYQAAFPKLFKPISSMPAGLKAHLRVPEDMFTLQANIYRTYHVSDPRVFYNKEDVWETPTEQSGPNSAAQVLQPYYVLMRQPGESQPEYLLILPFTPRGKTNMIAWLAARNDDPNYGQMVAYQLPKDINIFGPQQVANRIQQDPVISQQFSLLNQQGSSVVQGNLLVVPVGNGFLYFEPVYLKATGGQSIPELKKVILADSSRVVYADTLSQALDQLVGESTGVPPPSGGPPPTETIDSLLQQALQHYNAAQDALKKGDLGTYQKEMDEVGRLLKRIQDLRGSTPSTTSPSPGTTPRPTATPTSSTTPRPTATPTRSP